MKKKFIAIAFLLSIVTLAGCSQKKAEPTRKTEIKIACNQVSKVALDKAKKSMEKAGYKPKFITFSNNITALQAVEDGNADASFAQHKPFMESFNKQKDGHLAMVTPHIYYTGIGLYSNKYKNIKNLPNGAKITIMNDAMNRDNSLFILRDAGLIKLSKNKKSNFTLHDITSNPKHLQIIEVEQAQAVNSLKDVDGATCFFTFMFNAGKDYKNYLVRDQNAKDFPISLIVKKNNANKKWAKDIDKSFLTKQSKAGITDHFKGVFTFYD